MMSGRKFADEGDNPVYNSNIYNVQGDNRSWRQIFSYIMAL